jgi:hypothetical protein
MPAIFYCEFRQKGEIEKLRIRKCSDFGDFQSPEVRKKTYFEFFFSVFFFLFYTKNVLKSFEFLWLENNEICEKEITAPP